MAMTAPNGLPVDRLLLWILLGLLAWALIIGLILWVARESGVWS